MSKITERTRSLGYAKGAIAELSNQLTTAKSQYRIAKITDKIKFWENRVKILEDAPETPQANVE